MNGDHKIMRKRCWAVILCAAFALAYCGALADSWSGSVSALETVTVTAPADGIPEGFDLETGERVTEGESAGSVRMEKVFAPYDGTVSVVSVKEGEKASGTVLEISPVSLYTVTCTTSGVAKTPENAMIHVGETVIIRCMTDKSHQAEAQVISVDGAQFTVETTAGELYVGEAVYLYREDNIFYSGQIGKGTVTAHEELTVSAEGVIRQLRVQAGDRVERGQWLFSVSSSEENEIRIPASGIVTEVKLSAGEQVKENQELAEIAVSCAIRISVSADDAGQFALDQEWAYIRGDDPHEETHSCRVSRILTDAEDASAVVELIPEDETLLPVGMSVTVVDAQD